MIVTTFESELVACSDKLRGAAMSLFRNRHDADDAVQTTFARALERREQFTDCIQAWLNTILLNVFRDERRVRSRLIFTDDSAYADSVPCSDDTQTSFEAIEALKAVAAHPDGELLMQAGLGSSTEELADQFRCSAANVRQRVSRARRTLRENTGW